MTGQSLETSALRHMLVRPTSGAIGFAVEVTVSQVSTGRAGGEVVPVVRANTLNSSADHHGWIMRPEESSKWTSAPAVQLSWGQHTTSLIVSGEDFDDRENYAVALVGTNSRARDSSVMEIHVAPIFDLRMGER